MQFWIFFEPGLGGDGLANLLEKSADVCPLDVPDCDWRVHRIVDGRVKFYAPTPDEGECFRFNLRPFSLSHNNLRSRYLDLVSAQKNCVVTSHDITMENLESSDCQEILCRDQLKILLVGDQEEARLQAAKKNLQPVVGNDFVNKHADRTKFDLILDMKDLQRDWAQFKDFCNSLGLGVDRNYYDQYIDLTTGSTSFMTKNYAVEIYRSSSDGIHITYDLVDIWQPNTPHITR